MLNVFVIVNVFVIIVCERKKKYIKKKEGENNSWQYVKNKLKYS